MTEDIILLDPSPERAPVVRPRRARPASIEGARFGLLDINKARGNVFLDRLDQLLQARGHAVNRYSKARFSILAPTELKQRIALECDIVVEALADWGSCTSCCMHDIRDMEDRGLIGVGIASTEFISAAKAQNTGLAYDPAVVFVPHPIQDRTDEEMQKLADQAFQAILRAAGSQC